MYGQKIRERGGILEGGSAIFSSKRGDGVSEGKVQVGTSSKTKRIIRNLLLLEVKVILPMEKQEMGKKGRESV